MNCRLAALTAISLAFASVPAEAASLLAITAMDATGYGANLSVNVVEGWRFRPNEDVLVQEVGFYDSYADGLIRTYKVGIVAPDNSVLGSAIIPSGTAGRLDGPYDPGGPALGGSGFRYTALAAPVRLTAGNTYAVVAFITRGNTDPMPSPNTITYNTPYLTVSGTGLGGFFDCSVSNGPCYTTIPQIPDLRYPTKYSSSSRYVNFTFTSAVPLPAALPLFAAGLGGVLCRWTRRSGKSTEAGKTD